MEKTMPFKVTERVIDLVQALYNEGYTGIASLETADFSGAKMYLGDDNLTVKLSGFCKENLYLVDNPEEGNMVAVGRYEMERQAALLAVEDITDIAWDMYRTYKKSGYAMPDEFRDLFVKYGHLTKKTVTQTVYVEQD